MSFQFLKKIALRKAEEGMRITAYRNGWEVKDGFVCKRDFTDHQRKAAAKTGEAMPDGSFPIGNVEDLHNAVMLLHNAKHPSEAKEHIKRRAAALGATKELPKEWQSKTVAKSGPNHQFTQFAPGGGREPVKPEHQALFEANAKNVAQGNSPKGQAVSSTTSTTDTSQDSVGKGEVLTDDDYEILAKGFENMSPEVKAKFKANQDKFKDKKK